MSASVFKPIQPFRSDSSKLRIAATLSDKRLRIDKVRRALFEPMNQEETQNFLKNELEMHTANEIKKWEFDFVKGVPLSPSGTRGRFVWNPVGEIESRITCAPIKPRFSLEVDNSDLYHQPQNLEALPLRSDENTPILRTPEAQVGVKKQSKITDFMQARKRTADSAFAKKLTTPRPTKISRESHCS